MLFEAAAAGDEVAAGIVDAFADEVATMATALIRRLRLIRTDVEVVLGGGVLQGANGMLRAGSPPGWPRSRRRRPGGVLDVPPVYGAAVEAWTTVGAPGMRCAGSAVRSPPRHSRVLPLRTRNARRILTTVELRGSGRLRRRWKS